MFYMVAKREQKENSFFHGRQTRLFSAIIIRPKSSHAVVMERSKVEACVEAICNKGCQTVRQDISLLEQGEKLPELEKLTDGECTQVLNELKTIMAVYGDSCRI